MQPLQPAGITPASYWLPAEAPPPIRAIPMLAPELDPTTGTRLSLDVSADPTLTAIGVQLRTLRGSGLAVEDDGTDLPTIRKNAPEAPALIEFELARVLKPFVDAGTISVQAPEVTAGPSAGNVATVLQRVKLLRPGADPTDPR